MFDGMGGHTAGDMASLLASEILSDDMKKSEDLVVNEKIFFSEFCKHANDKIVELSNKLQAVTTGTTVAALSFSQEDVVLCNVGDSKVFRIRESQMLQISNDVEVVGIDEAQFFDSSIVEVVQTLANRGVRVIIAGLDTDFMGKPFGPMPALMAVAEDIQKVHAICVRCGSPANHSHRLVASDALVVLGEKDEYEPLCRECYQKAIAEEKAKQNTPTEEKSLQ